jgi:DNA-binding LacI/PurR family transcriptional regulator
VMGELAVKLLVEQLSGERREPRRIMLKPQLLVRSSVAPPRTSPVPR